MRKKILREENGSVYVTKNGYEHLGVMDIEYYKGTMQKMYETKVVMEGIQDMKDGQVQDGDIRSKYAIVHQ